MHTLPTEIGFPGSDSGRVATVVIGGVHTSTLFTLFVLPALYRLILPVPPVKILPVDR